MVVKSKIFTQIQFDRSSTDFQLNTIEVVLRRWTCLAIKDHFHRMLMLEASLVGEIAYVQIYYARFM